LSLFEEESLLTEIRDLLKQE